MKKMINPLSIVLVSIWAVYGIARLIAYLVIESSTLPESLFVSVGDFRLHHFVYGNAIIFVLSFLIIILGVKINKNLAALIYGAGLGLVLDEFLLWIGDTVQLNSKVVIIPYSFTVLTVVSIIILGLMFFKGNKL